jgi:hypothetical protein
MAELIIPGVFWHLSKNIPLVHLLSQHLTGLYLLLPEGEDSQINAVTYSMMINHDPLLMTQLVIVSGLTHKGSALVGVIRTQNPVSKDFLKRELQQLHKQ